MKLPLDHPDFALAWPKAVFAEELAYLADHGSGGQAMKLFRDAFSTETAFEKLRAEVFQGESPWNWYLDRSPAASYLIVNEILSRSDELCEKASRRPYFLHKQQLVSSKIGGPDLVAAKADFSRLTCRLDMEGLLDSRLGKDCVDDPRQSPSVVLEEMLGVPDIWPFDPTSWTEELFFSLIEAIYDLASYPRSISYFHEYADCGPHYGDFSDATGQSLFAHQVNDLLRKRGIRLELALEGDDIGRMVVALDQSYAVLVSDSSELEDRHTDAVRHAVALYRRRSGNRQDKKSAIVSLIGVLEREKALLSASGLGSKDENALFEIANRFALRHNNEKQMDDYSDEYLEWMFWLYLSTVQLVRGQNH